MAVLLFSTLASAQTAIPQTSAPDAPQQAAPPAVTSELPRAPSGKSTVLGGEIRRIDPVRDQLTLKIFGGKTTTILYDERTQAFRDGNKISVLKLRPHEHASIETTLDGEKVFALRIRVLTELPEGESHGQVASYDPGTEQLVINTTSLQHDALRLKLPANTPIDRTGQLGKASPHGSTADLVPGAILNVRFKSEVPGSGVVSHIDIVAIPGATFTFGGTLQRLDMVSGLLVLGTDEKSGTQDISFDPTQFPASDKLRNGATLRVATRFDGTRYVATDIKVE